MKFAVDLAELRGLALALLGDGDVRDALRRVLGGPEGAAFATVRSFARRWSCSPRMVHYWLGRGLPVVRNGRLVRIPVAQADAWVAQQAASGHAAGGRASP